MAVPAGLRKAKQYDWKDSNLSLFGSDIERQIKKGSASSEPAWKNAGQKPGLQIWRIEKFKVKEWPMADYGKFYDGDSYIVLNTYKEKGGDQLLYDVHFWIGKYSSQDEYGTAAYKTVELDTHLDDVPVQHREVQGHESDLFRSYFQTITILTGGVDSGFRSVKPEEYRPRLLHLHGDRYGVKVQEVPRNKGRVDSSDVYILDLGLKLVQWNGKGSNVNERVQAAQYMRKISDERGGKPKTETVDEGSGTEEFDQHLTEQNESDDVFEAADRTKELYRLSDASGKMSFSLAKKDKVNQSDFDSEDVFILDTKGELFVWIGHKTTTAEKRNAMTYAHNYLMKTDHPLIPITCLTEGTKNKAFYTAVAA